jgi:hypothetical protein
MRWSVFFGGTLVDCGARWRSRLSRPDLRLSVRAAHLPCGAAHCLPTLAPAEFNYPTTSCTMHYALVKCFARQSATHAQSGSCFGGGLRSRTPILSEPPQVSNLVAVHTAGVLRMVRVAGFEPAWACSRGKWATAARHSDELGRRRGGSPCQRLRPGGQVRGPFGILVDLYGFEP